MKLVLLALLAAAPVLACKCGPSRPICEDVVSAPSIFVGTVTDPGPTYEAIMAAARPKLPAAIQRKLANEDDAETLTLDEQKQIARVILPPDAHARIAQCTTEEELSDLTLELLPVPRDGRRPVRFTVHETFKGEPAATRTVWTGQGMGDCGCQFQLGHKYLVYTYRDHDREETGICTRTRPIENAADDLAYLRTSLSQSTIHGIVTSDPKDIPPIRFRDADPDHPVPAVTLRAESPAHTTRAVTTANGRFDFGPLPPGRYTLTAQAPGYRFPSLPKTVTLAGPGCAVEVLLAQPQPR